MRHYCRRTLDNKIELTTYATDMEDEVGTAQRLTKQEAENLRAQLEIGIEAVTPLKDHRATDA
jgi:hypothetical protein